MKKFFNAALEKAKAVWAYLKSLVRKSESEAVEAAEETAEAEPSVVENVVTVIGMCALVGVVAFVAGHIVVNLSNVLGGAYMFVRALTCWFGWMSLSAFDEFCNAFNMTRDGLFKFKGVGLAVVALFAVCAYIRSIIKSAHDNGCTVSECARRDLNRAMNYCKNHPYEVLLLVLASLIRVPGMYDARLVEFIMATFGGGVCLGVLLCDQVAKAVLMITALSCIRI